VDESRRYGAPMLAPRRRRIRRREAGSLGFQ
jgi:hypothetical protein